MGRQQRECQMQDLDLVHAVKHLFLFGSFRNGYKEWIFLLVKAIGIDPFNPHGRSQEKRKTILVSSFFNLPEVRKSSNQ